MRFDNIHIIFHCIPMISDLLCYDIDKCKLPVGHGVVFFDRYLPIEEKRIFSVFSVSLW